MSGRYRGFWLLMILVHGAAAWVEPVYGQGKSPPKEKQSPAADLYGDPLPPGALMRMGTVQFRHAIYVSSSIRLAFSADSKRLISASGGDRTVRIFEAATGKQMQALKFPTEGYWSNAAISGDGNSVAVGGPTVGVFFWNADRSKEWTKIPIEELRDHALSLSADGRLLALASSLGSIRLWETVKGKELPVTFKRATYVNELRLSMDGSLLAAVCGDLVFVWDVASGKELYKFPTSNLGQIGLENMALSADGKVLAAPNPSRQGQPDSIALWDLSTGKKVREFPFERYYDRAVFSPDGKSLAAGGSKSICVWDIASGKEHRKLPSSGSSLVYSPDSRTLAYRVGATICLWNLETGQHFPHRHGHQTAVRRVAFSPNGKLLASADYHKAILWDVATGKQIHLFEGHKARIDCLAFTADSNVLVSASANDCTIRRWDVAGGKEINRLTVKEAAKGKAATSFAEEFELSNDRRTLMLTRPGPQRFEDLTIQGWDLESGKELFHRKIALEDFRAEKLSSNGTSMYTAGLRSIFSRYGGIMGRTDPYAASPDGKAVALANWIAKRTANSSSSEVESFTLWESTTAQELLRIPTGPAGAALFSSDGRLLLTASADAFHLWDIATGKEFLRQPVHESFVGPDRQHCFASCLAFSPDSRSVATGLQDSTILLWDIRPERWNAQRVVPALGPRDFDLLWSDLAGSDGRKIHAALWTLSATGQPTVPFLKERLPRAAAIDGKRIRQLIADLDSAQFQKRQAASKQLADLEEMAVPALRAALKANLPLEQRQRIEKLLEPNALVCLPEKLRHLRSIQVLENIATPEAREVLADLVKGAPESRLTQEAHAALQRLAQRTSVGP
jgi:WD40 repeat protein